MHLLLIRHGDNDHLRNNILYARMPGIHLNEHGRQQAAALAGALRGAPLAGIYASPLERAVETAQPLAEAAGLEIQTDERLLDTDIGEWQGNSWKEMEHSPAWQVIQETPSRFRFPGGESFSEAQARIVAALETITTHHQVEDLLAVVFHADPIKMAVAHYLGLPLDNFQRLECDTGSVTLLKIGDKGAHLLWLNRRPPFDLPEFSKEK